jgi:hypothetical protein
VSIAAALSVLVGCSPALLVFNLVPVPARARGLPFYAVIFVSGFARSFLQPARQALGAELIDRSLYANAVAWRSSTWQSAAVIGPALGGLIYGFASARVAYIVDAIMMIVALTTFWSIAYETRLTIATVESIGDSLQSGLRFVFGESVLLGALTLDLFSVLLGGAEALLPVFADQILHVGPQGLGILRAHRRSGWWGFRLFGASPALRRGAERLCTPGCRSCIIGFGPRSFSRVASFCSRLSGMADNVSVLICSTLLQLLTLHILYGDVSSVNSIFVGSSNEIGAFESGLSRTAWDGAFGVLGGLASLGVVAAVGWKVPRLRRLGRIDELATSQAAESAGGDAMSPLSNNMLSKPLF